MAHAPYLSTWALSVNSSVFIFQPGSDSSLQFGRIDSKKGLTSASIAMVPTSPVPFLPDASYNFVPTSDQNGNLFVAVGKCSDNAVSPSVWQLSAGGAWTDLGPTSAVVGINVLAAGIASANNGAPNIHIFGGMCPDVPSSNWITDAAYSNQMVAIEPMAHTAAEVSVDNVPVAEAGSTMTPIGRDYQKVVLIGGHTQQAFINMSQVAVYSLSDQNWTFESVTLPPDAAIDSRSGHTAISSNDGKHVVILGGWVGDLSQAARPQLITLNAVDWTWTIPSQPSSGSGIYGHGAVMLDSHVMLVTGGYQIGKSEKPESLFYNVSSNQWLPNYQADIHPEDVLHDAEYNPNSRQAGLGLGLTLGLLALLGAVVWFLWYRQRPRRSFHVRNVERPFIEKVPMSLSPAQDSWLQEKPLFQDLVSQERTPPRGPRPLPHSSHSYQRAPTNIHPIDEQDEDNLTPYSSAPSSPVKDPASEYVLPVENPFQDQAKITSEDHEEQIQRLVHEWSTINKAWPPSKRQTSPERHVRNSSSVSTQSSIMSETALFGSLEPPMETSPFLRRPPSASDRLAVQVLSNNAHHAHLRSQSCVSTPPPTRARITPSLFLSPDPPSTAYEPGSHSGSRSVPLGLQQPNLSAPLSTIASSDDKSKHSHPPRPTTSATASYNFANDMATPKYSHGPAIGYVGGYVTNLDDKGSSRPQSRSRGWVGSIKRALTGSDRAQVPPHRAHGASTALLRPTLNKRPEARRTVSADETPWKVAQGAHGWQQACPTRPATSGQAEADADWDVELAAEQRRVQIMFTVPRERLRVVNENPDSDGRSLSSVSTHSVAPGTSVVQHEPF